MFKRIRRLKKVIKNIENTLYSEIYKGNKFDKKFMNSMDKKLNNVEEKIELLEEEVGIKVGENFTFNFGNHE
jgi:hypothetical protein